jgi:hypothetical protein
MDATPLTTNSVTFDLLARIYDPPKPLVLDKVQTRPDNYIIRFIQAVGLIAANCRDGDGNPIPVLVEGFAGVLDDESIQVACPRECWPEASLPLFDGAEYAAGFLFVVPGNTETLRMKGTLQVFVDNSSEKPAAPDYPPRQCLLSLRQGFYPLAFLGQARKDGPLEGFQAVQMHSQGA